MKKKTFINNNQISIINNDDINVSNFTNNLDKKLFANTIGTFNLNKKKLNFSENENYENENNLNESIENNDNNNNNNNEISSISNYNNNN